MKLIIGLGNPGIKYRHTRHNVGFMLIDYVLKDLEVIPEWDYIERFKSNLTEIEYKDEKFVFLKPYTYMNESGWAVSQYMNWYKIIPKDILVIHDDLDIRVGEFKITNKAPKVHNGLISIDKYLKTGEYKKLRIGIDGRNPDNKIKSVNYVLSKFLDTELDLLKKSFKESSENLLDNLLK